MEPKHWYYLNNKQFMPLFWGCNFILLGIFPNVNNLMCNFRTNQTCSLHAAKPYVTGTSYLMGSWKAPLSYPHKNQTQHRSLACQVCRCTKQAGHDKRHLHYLLPRQLVGIMGNKQRENVPLKLSKPVCITTFLWGKSYKLAMCCMRQSFLMYLFTHLYCPFLCEFFYTS